MPLPAPTASAASSVRPPANTESLPNSSRSGSSSNWWLQSSVARKVRWRGTALRPPAVNSLRGWSSLEVICSAESTPHPRRCELYGQRYAVQPPTYLRHGLPFRGVMTKEGSRWRARSMNSRTDS